MIFKKKLREIREHMADNLNYEKHLGVWHLASGIWIWHLGISLCANNSRTLTHP